MALLELYTGASGPIYEQPNTLPAKAYPDFRQALKLTFLLGLMQVACGFPLGVLFVYTQNDYYIQPIILGLINVFSFMLATGIGMVRGDVSPARAMPFRLPRIVTWLPILIASLGIHILMNEVANLVQYFMPLPKIVVSLLNEVLYGEKHLWQAFALLVVIAPLTEEIFFRGLMLNGQVGRKGGWSAILFSAAFFGIIHLNPWQMFPALFAGILFGWMFVRTGSLWPGIIGHAVNNGMPFVLQLFPGFLLPGYNSPATRYATFHPRWLDLLGFGLMTFGVGVLALIFRFTTPLKPKTADVVASGVVQ